MLLASSHLSPNPRLNYFELVNSLFCGSAWTFRCFSRFRTVSPVYSSVVILGLPLTSALASVPSTLGFDPQDLSPFSWALLSTRFSLPSGFSQFPFPSSFVRWFAFRHLPYLTPGHGRLPVGLYSSFQICAVIFTLLSLPAGSVSSPLARPVPPWSASLL